MSAGTTTDGGTGFGCENVSNSNNNNNMRTARCARVRAGTSLVATRKNRLPFCSHILRQKGEDKWNGQDRASCFGVVVFWGGRGGEEGQWQQWPMLTVFYRGIRWKNQKSNHKCVSEQCALAWRLIRKRFDLRH